MKCGKCSHVATTVDIAADGTQYPCIVMSVCHKCDELVIWGCLHEDPVHNVDPHMTYDGELIPDSKPVRWSEALGALHGTTDLAARDQRIAELEAEVARLTAEVTEAQEVLMNTRAMAGTKQPVDLREVWHIIKLIRRHSSPHHGDLVEHMATELAYLRKRGRALVKATSDAKKQAAKALEGEGDEQP
jgi:uncharacterized small protein (DUF1192 family)